MCFCARPKPRITHDATPTESSLDCGLVVPVVFTFCSKAGCLCHMEVKCLAQWTLATLQHMSKNQNTHLSTQIGCVDQSIYCTKIHLGPNSTDGTINLLKKWQHTTTNITLEKTQTRCHFDAILPNTMDLFVRLNRWVYVTSWWWFEHDRRPRFATGKLTIRKPKPKVPRDCHQKLQCFLWNPTWKHEETKMKKKCLPKNHTTHNEWLQTHQYKLCKI